VATPSPPRPRSSQQRMWQPVLDDIAKKQPR
jgi:hypothetical protein